MSSTAEIAVTDSVIRNEGNRELSRFGHTWRKLYWVTLPRPISRISGPESRGRHALPFGEVRCR